MSYAIFFLLGLLTSRWFEQTLSRAVLKLPVSESVKSSVRRNARDRFDLKERGKIVSLSDADMADELAKGGLLFDELRKDESPD